MPKNRAPKCRGFNPNFTLSARTCLRYKIDRVFVDLPAKEWGEPKRLAEAAARVYGRVGDVSKIRNSIIRSLKDLAMQHTQRMSIEKYTSDCRDHLKDYPLSQFMDDYIAIVYEQEELKLRQQNEHLKRIMHLKSDNTAMNMVNDSLDSLGSLDNAENNRTRPSNPTGLEPSENHETEDDMTTEEKEERDIWSRLHISAEGILAKMKNGEEISVSDRKVMSSGISCILDLVDLNPDGQAAIIGDKFDNIKAKYLTRYKMQTTSIMPELKKAIGVVSKLCTEHNNTEDAQQYLDESILKANSTGVKAALRLLSNILETLRTQQKLLSKAGRSRITETDYLVTIWGPLIRQVCSLKSLVRLKCGESINPVSTSNKAVMYNDDKHVVGFKIDIRLVHDEEKIEFDVAAGEVARNMDSNDKIFKDQGKLIREGKDVFDTILLNAIDSQSHTDLSCCMLQIAGLVGEVSSMHMVRPGQYVVIPQRKLHFPSSLQDMAHLENLIEGIFLFIVSIDSNDFDVHDTDVAAKTNSEENSRRLSYSSNTVDNRRLSLGATFNRGDSCEAGSPWTSEIPNTWYSPPQKRYWAICY